MNKDIRLSDIQRILAGEVPPEFFIEIIIRLIFIYFICLLAMRLMGKRMVAQLSRNELTALVSIAAAVGVAIQAPDKGLIPALIIVFIIIFIGRFIAWKASRHQKFEKVTQGNIQTLVKDSVLQLQAMQKIKLSKERVFAQLRSQEIKTLGAVKRFYMEANGQFSLIKEEPPKEGLSIVPDWDNSLYNEQEKSTDKKTCLACGWVQEAIIQANSCKNCNSTNWTIAVK
jgi:uncharacterized membrane protein YcaP (DUF421 family)